MSTPQIGETIAFAAAVAALEAVLPPRAEVEVLGSPDSRRVRLWAEWTGPLNLTVSEARTFASAIRWLRAVESPCQPPLPGGEEVAR